MSSSGPESLAKAQARRVSTKQFGLVMFLASLTMIFGATVIAYLITRYNHPAWGRLEVGAPWGTLLATVILAAVSFTLEYALRAIRRNQQRRLLRGLQASLALAVLFLLTQVHNWSATQRLATETNQLLSLFTFYLLTGVHAAHVLGGLIPLGIVYRRATEREYSSSRLEGVLFCVQYWHFLMAVWLVLVAIMFLA